MLEWLEVQKEKLKNESPRKRFIRVIIVLLLLIVWYEIPVTEHIKLKEDKISSPFRLALVTDLHSCSYSKDQTYLVKMIDDEKPDAVLLSGDIFDDRLSDNNTKAFISAISGRYKCFVGIFRKIIVISSYPVQGVRPVPQCGRSNLCQ